MTLHHAIAVAAALALFGCTPAPGNLPLAHAHLGRQHGLVLGGMASATFTARRRGESFREPPRCARAFDEATGYQPATDSSCVLDGQGYLIGRKDFWSAGGMVYGGQHTGLALGGVGALHVLDSSPHALTLGGGLGLAFIEGELSYGLRAADDVWLFISPGLGAGGQQVAQRINAGVRIDVLSRLSLVAQGGWARRVAEHDFADDHSYFAWHAGLGLSFLAYDREASSR